ncbi:RNA polymerase sigma factor [Terriglobus sp. TAA 43]|uniref:RNA polymerase sigma factor n=1 Tax=Terriglobus sp. TAA 43 TaxID=278961 RepID=UPI0021010B96|nr:RNA polymerase sigma factor [Terriglobus sp. TAA 43]
MVTQHQDMVFRMLVRLTGSRENVDDLAQDVFLRLYRALPSFRGEALLTTYLHRIVVNVAQDEWKRRKRIDQRHTSISDETSGWEDRLHHPSPNAEQELATRELQLRVEEEMGKLSAVERSILVLYHQEERSYQQIAESLRLPIGTVRTHLHRGRNKLRTALERRGGWQ